MSYVGARAPDRRRSPLRLVAAACAACFVAARLLVATFAGTSSLAELGVIMVVPYAALYAACGWVLAWLIERFAATVTTRPPFDWIGPGWTAVLILLAGGAGAGLAKIELADTHERLRPRVLDADSSVAKTQGWEGQGCARLVAASVVCEGVQRGEAPAPVTWNGQPLSVDCSGAALTVSRGGASIARVPVTGGHVVDVLAVELPAVSGASHVALLARLQIQEARDQLAIVDGSGKVRHRELLAVSGLPMREKLALCETAAGERRLLLDVGQAWTYRWRP